RLSEGNYSEDAKNALFITIKGRISDMTVRRIVSKVFRLSGVKKRVYPHLIRHTFATHLLEEGMNLKGVQELLGHKNIQTTEVYTHVSIKRLVDVYNKFHPRSQGPIYNGNSHKEE
ncbi:MAG: tyrosine-type recombinase/integrase, partial [candidate division WOR-3 bacterium]